LAKMQTKREVILDNMDELLPLLGKFDEHLSLLEESFAVDIIAQRNGLSLRGDGEEVEKVYALFQELLVLIRGGHLLTTPEFNYALRLAKEGQANKIKDLFNDLILIAERGKKIRPKTLGQKRYVEALRRHDIVFGIGPAGTGKTYLAMAMAVSALKNKTVQRLILTRPAVEAGESLGFLPGDLHEKVDPYLRPLYDALYDLMGVDNYLKNREKGIIEVAPLAYMRGRTLDDSFIILDEAQNTTTEQMKMFLTRMGFGSKVVVTGDITQVDLPKGKFSGLIRVMHILKGIKDIAFVQLGEEDVVRHHLVQKIIKAYEAFENKQQSNE
jgi:phosphate starvation-inducible PhoH-like protein